MNKITALLLLSSAIAVPAFAADEGFYVGINVGRASTDYDGSNSPTGFAFQVGYQVNKNVAVEAQYADFGNIDPIVTWKISGYSISAVGILPFNDDWSAFAKLGYASIDSKLTDASVFDGTYSKSAATYGIGGQFNFDEAVGLRFGVDRYSTGGTSGAQTLNDGTVTFLYAGVRYLF